MMARRIAVLAALVLMLALALAGGATSTGATRDFPFYWGDAAYDICKRYEEAHFRPSEKEAGDLPVLPSHLKGICGTFQDTFESWCEYKQSMAFRENQTIALTLAAHSADDAIERWGRAILEHFVEWIFTKSPGNADESALETLRYSINEGFKIWFNSCISGELPPRPPPAQENAGTEAPSDANEGLAEELPVETDSSETESEL